MCRMSRRVVGTLQGPASTFPVPHLVLPQGQAHMIQLSSNRTLSVTYYDPMLRRQLEVNENTNFVLTDLQMTFYGKQQLLFIKAQSRSLKNCSGNLSWNMLEK